MPVAIVRLNMIPRKVLWKELIGRAIYSLNQTVSDLFDLYLPDKDFGGYVGYVLENQAEAEPIKQLSRALLPLYEYLPSQNPFTDGRAAALALSMPAWKTLVDSDRKALDLMPGKTG
ncbi:hypothetical protein [Nocardia sp. NPDC059239]|uniref:hypothetical protein n=1 Tax=unclassified Nocardia TaxID=2637762 RepID=UPI00369C506F